ncbi:MAG: hypothetical protein QW733_02760 [Desulfurococcaceae archaeon]
MYIFNNNIVDRARTLGEHAIKRLKELQEKYVVIGDERTRTNDRC